MIKTGYNDPWNIQRTYIQQNMQNEKTTDRHEQNNASMANNF